MKCRERLLTRWAWPYWPQEWEFSESPWLRMFQNARLWCEEVHGEKECIVCLIRIIESYDYAGSLLRYHRILLLYLFAVRQAASLQGGQGCEQLLRPFSISCS